MSRPNPSDPIAATPWVSAKGSLIQGAAWFFGMRYAIRGLGLLSTLITARLLTPADYSVVAMAMLVVGLVSSLLELGTATALLRKESVCPEEIDSAWTLRMLQMLGVGGLVLAAAVPAVAYFQDERVLWILLALACSVAFSGLSNMGHVLAQKTLDFSFEFRHGVVCKAIGVVVTVLAALTLGDWRALVLGIMAGHVSGCLMSYAMHPHRPRWQTRHIREIWATTRWLMLGNAAGFLLRKADEFAAARLGSAEAFGAYHVGSDLGQLPAGELGGAIVRVLLPVLSTIQSDMDRVHEGVIKSMRAINGVTLPIAAIFSALAEPATRVLLGPQWGAAVAFVAVFAFVSAIPLIGGPLTTLLVLRGHAKAYSMLVWLEFAAFAAAGLILYPLMGLLGLAVGRLMGSAVLVLTAATIVHRRCGLPLKASIMTLTRPAIGAALAAWVAHAMTSWDASAIVELLLGGLIGVLVYAVWSLLSWRLVGRPEGLESTVMDGLDRVGILRKLGRASR